MSYQMPKVTDVYSQNTVVYVRLACGHHRPIMFTSSPNEAMQGVEAQSDLIGTRMKCTQEHIDYGPESPEISASS